MNDESEGYSRPNRVNWKEYIDQSHKEPMNEVRQKIKSSC
jgi:hypothetical protein